MSRLDDLAKKTEPRHHETMNDPVNHDLRLTVYRSFLDQSRAPTSSELAETLDRDLHEVRAELEALAEAHVLVLDPKTREIAMAMPFSAEPTAFRVETDDRAWWANCAWDALGIPALLGREAVARTACPVSGDEMTLEVDADGPVGESPWLVHFALPAKRWWDDIFET